MAHQKPRGQEGVLIAGLGLLLDTCKPLLRVGIICFAAGSSRSQPSDPNMLKHAWMSACSVCPIAV